LALLQKRTGPLHWGYYQIEGDIGSPRGPSFASEAKQSRGPELGLNCFVASLLAMTALLG